VSLEFLRPEHGHEQVSEQQQGNHAHNKVFHKFLLQLLAAADIQTADHEKQDGDSDIDKISHMRFTFLLKANSIHAMPQVGTAAGGRVIKNDATGVKISLKRPGLSWAGCGARFHLFSLFFPPLVPKLQRIRLWV
jgi:hypothetical protein